MNAFKFAFAVVVCVMGAQSVACNAQSVATQDSDLATSTIDALRSQFKFPAHEATDGTSGTLPARSVIPQAAVASLKTNKNNDLTATSTVANVVLPGTAAGSTIVATSNNGMSIAVAIRGAKSVAALPSGGSALYSNADSHGGHVVQTVIRDGVESFVSFEASPSSDAIFDVSMNGVSGLRFVEGVVEFLDNLGAPRLRMSQPFVIDSAGVVAAVTTSIEGCSYDVSPRAPWGRKVTAPGATSCALHMSWSDDGLTYPVLLDPSWTTTGSMTSARRWHGAILLSTLKLLAIGGEGVAAGFLGTSELYDPSSGTWASTGRLHTARRRFTTTGVDSGLVLIAGGEVSTGRTAIAERYNPTTGLWSFTGSMTSTRAYHDAVYLSSIGKVLVAGGMNSAGTVLSSAELYDPSAGTWSATGSLGTARQNASLTALADQTAIVIGGVDGSANVLASSEIFNPSGGTWAVGASLTTARHRHRTVRITDNNLVVTGGFTDSGATTATAAGDLYDTTLATFFAQDSIGSARGDHAALPIPGNRMLAIGGSTGSSQLADTQIYAANTASAASNGNLGTAVAQESATMLGTGYALVAGGTSPTGITNIATTSGPYFYVYDRTGQYHQLQFTSASGSWNTSFSFSLKYDSTAVNVTYDWVGGVGASLRATVTDAVGNPLGTVVTAHKGDTTFTAPSGSPQVTENRNLVTSGDISFLDDKTIVLGPEYTMKGIYDSISAIPLIDPWFNEWTFTTRASIADSTVNQPQLWQAITDTLTTSRTTSDPTQQFKVSAETSSNSSGSYPNGAWIVQQDCTEQGHDCTNNGEFTGFGWFYVDTVRKHYSVDHGGYPQFFEHHYAILEQMEQWITIPGGWQDQCVTSCGANQTCINGCYVLPYGRFPYWDSGTTTGVPDDGDPTQNFLYTQLPEGQSWGLSGRNCHTGSTASNGHGDPTHGNGQGGRVDSYYPAPQNCSGSCDTWPSPPPYGCDWEASLTFLHSNYYLAYPTDSICSASNQTFFFGDIQHPLDCANYTSNMGFHGWHDCVHGNIGGSNFFGAFDSPASPFFYLWHAWVNHFYQMRLDCYGVGP